MFVSGQAIIFRMDGGKSFDKPSLRIKFPDSGHNEIIPDRSSGPRKNDEEILEEFKMILEKYQGTSISNSNESVSTTISFKERLSKILGFK